MSTKYTHCYSNYVNHILNNSPTKAAFTFPRTERFSSPKKKQKAPLDQVLQKVPDPTKKYIIDLPIEKTHPSGKNPRNNKQLERSSSLSNKRKSALNIKPESRKAEKSPKKVVNLVDKYIHAKPSNKQKNLERSPSKSKSKTKSERRLNTQVIERNSLARNSTQRRKLWEKGEQQVEFMKSNNYPGYPVYPIYPYVDHLLYKDLQAQNHHYLSNRYLKYSPYYQHYLGEDEAMRSLLKAKKICEKSPSIPFKSKKRSITETTFLQQIDHPSKNITLQGYYPVGKELNQNGKYPVSTFKQTFIKDRNTPSHSFGNEPTNRKKEETSKKSDGKGKLLSNKSEKEICYRNMPISQETYMPFSQFGYVNPFHY